jgi:hypothetical protein
MSEASSKSSPPTCVDTTSATSSPASEDGVTPSDLQDGPMTDLFGQALVPANPSRSQGGSVAQQMSATYGLRSAVSSASAALQHSWASKLQERLDTRGGTMFTLTWKAQATPLRRQICRLAASAPRTGDSGCGGWATPTTRDWKDGATTLENTPVNSLLGRQVLGAISPGSPAQTGRPGRLSPLFSAWLQGYPPEWCLAAPESKRRRE